MNERLRREQAPVVDDETMATGVDQWFAQHPEQTWTSTTAEGRVLRHVMITHCAEDLVMPGKRFDPVATRIVPTASTQR